jgi:hypothetical protein
MKVLNVRVPPFAPTDEYFDWGVAVFRGTALMWIRLEAASAAFPPRERRQVTPP